MLKHLLLLILLLVQPFLFAARLDTLQKSLRIFIKNPKLPAFTIPIESINGERQEVKYSYKLGSHEFNEKRIKNKFKCVLVELNDSVALFKDGLSSIRIQLEKSQNRLNLHITNSSNPSVYFDIYTSSKEQFYGGGIQFSHVALNGKHFSNVAEENGIGRGDQPISRWTKLAGVAGHPHSSYFPLAYFVSDANRGFGFETDQLVRIQFDSDSIRVKVQSKRFTINLFQEDTMLGIVAAFSAINGRGNPIPSWAMSSILGIQGGMKEVERKITQLGPEAKLNAIWIQDWVGKRPTKFGSRLNWQWMLDTLNYSGIRSWCNARDLKLLGYINPFFAETGKYTEEGILNGFLQKNAQHKSGLFDFGGMKGYLLDLKNVDARNWMKDIIKLNLVHNGFDGWMCDFGEWETAKEMVNGDGWHNTYVREWIKLNNEVNQESGNELFIFHRSGTLKTAFYSQSIWLGDQLVSYGENDGLPSVLNAMNSSGISGLPPVHSDIGGYTAVDFKLIKKYLRSEELLFDWIRLEAFTPVFRTHEGLKPDKDLQVYSTPEISKFYTSYSEINSRLLPYFQSLIKDYTEQGIPVFRHPILVSPNTQSSSAVFVGNDVLIVFDPASDSILPDFYRYVPSGDANESARIQIHIRQGSQVEELLLRLQHEK
jgi:sulfoquinovosidase